MAGEETQKGRWGRKGECEGGGDGREAALDIDF